MGQPVQLGKYRLLRRIAVGGMAEVFLGQASGPAGFSKLVAIKCIHPRMADSGEFVDMFLDEARLAARLDHPNIVQILDLGRVDQRYFLAMEYVQGPTLRQVVRRAEELDELVPLDAVFAVAQGVLSALSFAHDRRSLDGQPAPVIHRDVSPQNILISYSGNVKLADFGIAKAQGRVSVTQDGVVKGKAYYMAPEQMYQGRVDPRSDLYSFGVVLFEALTNQRLFGSYTQAELFNPRLRKKIPRPSAVAPGRSAEIDAFMLKLLDNEPERRFQSATEALGAMQELMLATRQVASTERLGATMRRMFAEEHQAEERALSQSSSPGSGLEPLQDQPTLIKERAAEGTEELPATEPRQLPLEEAETSVSTPASGSVQPVPMPAPAPPRRAPWGPIAIGVVLGLVVAAMGLYALRGRNAPLGPAPAAGMATAGGLDAATVTSLAPHDPDSRPVARVRLKTRSPREAARQLGADSGPAQGPRASAKATVRPRSRARAPRRARRAHAHRPHVSRTTGTLSLTATPGGEVLFKGRSLGRTPLRGVALPAGTHTLRLRNPAQRVDYRFRVTVPAGQHTDHKVALGTGTLLVNAIPWARVYLDGTMLDVTPLKPLKLYQGVHLVELVYPAAPGKRRYRVRVKVRAGGMHKVIHNFLKEGGQ